MTKEKKKIEKRDLILVETIKKEGKNFYKFGNFTKERAEKFQRGLIKQGYDCVILPNILPSFPAFSPLGYNLYTHPYIQRRKPRKPRVKVLDEECVKCDVVDCENNAFYHFSRPGFNLSLCKEHKHYFP